VSVCVESDDYKQGLLGYSSARMSPDTSSSNKIGAAVYLKNLGALRLSEFAHEFKQLWPSHSFLNTGKEPDAAFFQVDESEFAVHLRRTQIPASATEAVLTDTNHWPDARFVLDKHKAHLAVVGTVERGKELHFASDLTKAIVALLGVTDSMAVFWLNGPVLHPAEDFAAIAKEMFGAGLMPLLLWIGMHWKSEVKALHTKGMVQFGAPEIMLIQQNGPSPDLAGYLFDVANYILTSCNEILDGETMDGPNGVLKVSSLKGNDPNKRMLVLQPVRPT
jgi:hypothetical protein